MTKPTVDERMEQWLIDDADRNGIADMDRPAYLDALRGTYAYAAQRLEYTFRDLVNDPGIPRLLRKVMWWLP